MISEPRPVAILFYGFTLIWFLASLIYMTGSTYGAIDYYYAPETSFLTGALLILVCGILCLTPIGWIISFYWMVRDWDWSLFQIFMVYGVFIIIYAIILIEFLNDALEASLEMENDDEEYEDKR